MRGARGDSAGTSAVERMPPGEAGQECWSLHARPRSISQQVANLNATHMIGCYGRHRQAKRGNDVA
jgi:hypothetical protein